MIVLKKIYCWIANKLRRDKNISWVIVGRKCLTGELLYKKEEDGFYYPTNE